MLVRRQGDRVTEPTFAEQIASTGITVRPRHFHVNKDHESLLGRSIALRLGLVLYILGYAAVIALDVYVMDFLEKVQNGGFRDEVELYDTGEFIDRVGLNLMVIGPAVMLFCIVTYCMFIHRAASNIENANAKGLSVTPGWAVGWSFIPFVNLLKIYQVMREIWSASADPRRGLHGASLLLAVWWIFYVCGNIISNVAGRMADAQLNSAYPDIDQIRSAITIEMGASALSILSGILLFLVIGGITRNQARWKDMPQEAAAAPPVGATSALGF